LRGPLDVVSAGNEEGTMAFEVDFLGVGRGERSADAIALRITDATAPTGQRVMVIDGGTQDSGEELVAHVQSYYGTKYVDYVVLTHPDADHASGLTVVLDKLSVGTLVMHKPWEHANEIRSMFFNDRIPISRLEGKLERALQNAKDLEVIANRKRIPIVEPFAGVGNASGSFLVLGPTEQYYQSLICDFRSTPQAKESPMLQALRAAAEKGLEWVSETLQFETLTDGGVTSAENNSSAIILVSDGQNRLLFTGDAGIPALLQATGFADSSGNAVTGLKCLQVPHHGSRRNLGPSVLDRLSGTDKAFVSCCKDGAPKHPSQRVINALVRRRAEVFTTCGKSIRWADGFPARDGWTAAAVPRQFVGSFQE